MISLLNHCNSQTKARPQIAVEIKFELQRCRCVICDTKKSRALSGKWKELVCSLPLVWM